MAHKVVVYTRHAKRRMKWRKISEEEIISTLSDPDEIQPLEDGKEHVYKTLEGRYIRVTRRELESEIVVITVVDKSD